MGRGGNDAGDPLTGLPSRHGMWRWLALVGRRAEREGWPLSVAMVDLDDFKTVNDRFGHEEGDRVLREWGRFVQRHLPRGARAFRYGGDEVLVVFPRYSRADAVACLRGWVQNVRKDGIGGYHMGISAGVASYPEDTPRWVELVSLADTALLEAKAQGKFTVSTLERPDTRFRWPPPFVPRPLEARTLDHALRTHPIVVVVGPPGVGKSRLIEEVVLRRYRSVVRTTPRPGAWGVWVSREHLDRGRLQEVVGTTLLQGGKVIVEIWPRDMDALIRGGLHQAWREGWIQEVHVPPMGEEQVRLLIRRALRGWIPRRLVQEVNAWAEGRPAYIGALLQALIHQGLLRVRGGAYRFTGIPPLLEVEGIRTYWETHVDGLSPHARRGLGILGLGGGTLSLEAWRQTLHALAGKRIPEDGVLEALAHLVEVREDRLSLRERAFTGFAARLLTPEEARIAAEILLQASEPRDEVQTLTLMERVDAHRALTLARDLVEEGIQNLNVLRVQRVLLWVQQESSRRDLPWVRIARGWLAFVQGEPGESQRVLAPFPMEELPPVIRHVRVAACMDTGCLDEVKSALAWWLDHARGQERDEARVDQAWVFLIEGKHAQAERILKPLLHRPLSPHARARVAYGLGQIAMFSRRYRRALRYYQKALELLRAYAYPRAEAVILTVMAFLHYHRGDLVRVDTLVQEAMDRAREAGTSDVEAFLLEQMAALHLDRGYLDPAYHTLREALEVCTASGMVRVLANVYQGLARWALYRGDVHLAESHLSRAASIARERMNDPDFGTALRMWIRWERGEPVHVDAYTRHVDLTQWSSLEPVLMRRDPSLGAEVYRRIAEEPLADLRSRFARDLMGALQEAQQGNAERALRDLLRARRRLPRFRSPYLYGIYLGYRGHVLQVLGKTREGIRLQTRAHTLMANLGMVLGAHRFHPEHTSRSGNP